MNTQTISVEHIQKYMQHAAALGVSFKDCAWINDVVDALLRGDLYLNSIPLKTWDNYHAYYVTQARSLKLETGGWSLANSVCTAKTSATISALIVLGYPVETAEQVKSALDALAQNAR